MEERNELIKELFELHKFLAEKGEISIGYGFSENYERLEAKVKKLTIPVVIKRFFVIYDYPSKKLKYMETALTEEEVNEQEMWIVESEHNNKEEAQKECDRLNAL